MVARTTIRDIARETGLSITAVSLVLNHRPNKISETSRKMIENTARRMNYISSQQKRMSAVKKIGVVVPDLTNLFFANFVDGADSVVSQEGHQLLLAFTNNDPEREAYVVRTLYQQNISGMIITTSTATTAKGYRQMFQAGKVPVVLVDRVHPSFSYSSMTYNHHKGAYFAVRHLLDLGHRRIACLSGDGGQHTSSSQRVQGYLWAFEERGIPAPEEGVFEGNYLEDGGYKVADAILARGFTALFSCNDMMAYGFYKRAKELCKAIPGDISVVGYDDLFFSNLLDPPLTTVRQDPRHLGCRAVEQLLREMSGADSQHQDIRFEPALVIRDSTRPLSGQDV